MASRPVGEDIHIYDNKSVDGALTWVIHGLFAMQIEGLQNVDNSNASQTTRRFGNFRICVTFLGQSSSKWIIELQKRHRSTSCYQLANNCVTNLLDQKKSNQVSCNFFQKFMKNDLLKNGFEEDCFHIGSYFSRFTEAFRFGFNIVKFFFLIMHQHTSCLKDEISGNRHSVWI